MLRARAELLTRVREFFSRRGVLEVDTPLLRPTSVPDPAIAPIAVPAAEGWLQTSPELAMKCLLALGSGDIYQMSHVFRAGERGRLHQPEFTLIEWYRVGWTLDELIDETVALITMGLQRTLPVERFAWADLLQEVFGCGPFEASHETLRVALGRHVEISDANLSRGELLDLMYAHALELRSDGLIVVEDFPVEQAALARVEERNGRLVARRFEVACAGVELANGYYELIDGVEQRRRFEAEIETQFETENSSTQELDWRRLDKIFDVFIDSEERLRPKPQ